MTDLRGSRLEELVCINKEGDMKDDENRNDN